MHSNPVVSITRNRYVPLFIVSVASLIAVAGSYLSLRFGQEGISHHIFYIPVVLACFFYAVPGFWFSLLLIFLYSIFSITMEHPAPSYEDMAFHLLNFLLVGGVIAYLARKWDSSVKSNSAELLKALYKAERYRLLLDNFADPVFTVTPDGGILYVNGAFSRISGRLPDFFAGKNMWELLQDEKPVERAALIDEILRTGIEKQIEMKVPAGGEIRYFLTTISPVRSTEGAIDYLVCYGKDITGMRAAEKALKHSLENLQRSQEIGRLADWRLDLNTNIFSGSDTGYELIGFDRNEPVTGETIFNIFEPEDRSMALEAMERAVATNGSYSVVVRIRRKNDGQMRYLLSSAQVETDSDNRPVAIFGINQDITERIQVEEALRESEELNRIVTSLTTDYVYIVDVTPDKKASIRWVSENMPEITGRSRESLSSMEAWGNLFPPGDYEKFLAFMQRTLDSCEAGSLECRSIRGDDIHWINIYAFPKKRDTGGITVYGAVKDITDRKNAEAGLMRFKFMVENAGQEVFLAAPDGNIEYVNRAAAASLGYTVDEMQGMNITGLDPLHGPFYGELFNELKAAGRMQAETEHVARDGRKIIKDMIAVYLVLENREYVCAFLQDITDKKRAEEERRKLQDQLSQAQKMESVGRLAGGVAHDFNNMLGVIIGQAELALMKSEKQGRVYDSLREIEKAARRSADLTSQLLAFARKQAVAPKVVDLNRTISGMISMLRRLIGEDIELEWIPESHLWSVRIDPAQVDQVLANLCVNSRDAIAGIGRITISTSNVVLDESWSPRYGSFLPGDYVLLSVSDTGSGFTPEGLTHIFEPFFSTKELGKGTGLGLAMVYGIVKQNGGFIDVRSTEGEGTTFMIYLPRCELENAVTDDGLVRKIPEGGTETILLVEDEPMLLDMTRSMLEDLGYSVIATSDPLEAMRIAREWMDKIKLLMTDVIMPGINGRDLSSRILEIIPGVKRMFMSGYTSDVIAPHGILEDGVHFIQKPFTLKDLSAQVRGALGRDDAAGE